MSTIVKRNGSLTTSLNLEGLDKLKLALQELLRGDILERAAVHLQDKAFNAMRNQYFNTKSNRIYKNKGSGGLENALFAPVPAPIRKGNSTISFQFWAGFGALNKSYPHLRYQEFGTKASVDRQPYVITSFRPGNKGRPWKLGNITKADASGKKQAGLGVLNKGGKFAIHGRGGRFSRQDGVTGSILKLKVPHPALRARGFIAAGNFLIKTEGERIIRNFINAELRKYNA